jgi:predicted ATPase
LLDYLCPKRTLLIMDNFEHLLEGTGLVTEILRAAPGVKILATSRARLNVGGEHRFRIAGMIYPDEETAGARWETLAQQREDVAQHGAVKLFLQGARRARPGFELTDENLSGVVQICRLVDGLPLGIRLAAAWVEMLTPAGIAAEIGRSLDFLETERRDVPGRQRSMRAAFDHSWNLLSEAEREVFQRLSVFRGGFTREAVHRVTGGSLRELRALVDRSLLEWDPAPSTSLPSMALGTGRTGGRYDIHELLRQYGEERLGKVPAEQEAARDRHCAYYAEYLQGREAHLMGREQRQALAEIEAEIENVRAGWDWAVVQGKVEEIDRSLESLAEFYRLRAWFQEGEQTFARAAQGLAADQSDIESRPEISREFRIVLGKVLMHQGRFCDPLGLVEQGVELFRKSLAILRELDARREMAYGLCYLWDEPSCQEALAIFQEIGDRRGIALSLRGLAGVAIGQGEYGAARQLVQESLAIFRELGNQEEIASSLSASGYIAYVLGEWEVAKELHQESLALYEEIGDQQGVAQSLEQLGIDAYGGSKEYEECKQLLQESFAIYEEIGNVSAMAWVLSELSELANRLGEYAEAMQLAQKSVPLAKRCRDRTLVPWTLRVLGRAACGMGDLGGAKRYFRQALETAMTERATPFVLATFDGIAMLLAAEGERERALELSSLILHHPAIWQAIKDSAASLVAELEAELPPDVVAAAQERGRARDLEATVAELLVELGA